MILYPREWSRKKDSAFASIAKGSGQGGRALLMAPLRLRGFPESAERSAMALARAKKQPKGWQRRLKAWLIRSQYNWARHHFSRHPQDVALCWNGLTGSRWAFMQGARDAGAAGLLHAEIAPFPGRMTLDPAGVNAEGAVPKGQAFYQAWAADVAERRGDGWRAMGQGLVARNSRRSDVGQAQGDAEGLAEPFLFVPMQVPDDSQMRLFAGWAGGLDGFIAALGRTAAALPPGWHLRVKEHPSARISVAPQLAAAVAASGGRLRIDNATDSFAQLAASRGVLTINSSMGLQAFFHDKPVIATGAAFWAQPGLACPAESEAALVTLLAGAESLGWDPAFRAIFMNWLDQVYYPAVEIDAEGRWHILAAAVQARLTPGWPG